MGFLGRLTEGFRALLREDFNIPTVDIDVDEDQFRRLTGKQTLRDLDPLTQEMMQERVFFASKSQPQAARIVGLHEAFADASGIKWKAEDKDADAWLREFWTRNELEDRIPVYGRELSIFGELAVPAVVLEGGRVKLAAIDPSEIQAVKPNPDDVLDLQEIILKRRVSTDKDGKEVQLDRRLQIVKMNPETGFLEGEVFYAAVNRVSKQIRGHSDLLPIVDWLDIYDAFLLTRAERAKAVSSFFWDVVVDGATEVELRKIEKKIKKEIKSGSYRLHNQKVTWNPVSPKLESGDAQAEADLIMGHILAGAGFPEFWFGQGKNANKAVASEMGIPTAKSMFRRQRFIRFFIAKMLLFALHQGKAAGRIPKDASDKITIKMPPVMTRDLATVSASINQGVSALTIATANGWLSDETASEITAFLFSQYGLDIDPQEEVEVSPMATLKRATQDAANKLAARSRGTGTAA